MIVQDARKSPTSGKIVTSLGSYDPHTKSLVIDKEKAGLFLSNGAQPSSRVVSLLAKDGVKIPDWAQKLAKKERSIKNTDKLRKNRPAAESVPEVTTEVAEVVADEPVSVVSETPIENVEQVPDVESSEVVVEAADPVEEVSEVTPEQAEPEASGPEKDDKPKV